MRTLRWMCGVTCKDKIRNENVRGKTKVAQASKKITERRLIWYGHVMRRDEEHICDPSGRNQSHVGRVRFPLRPEMHGRAHTDSCFIAFITYKIC